MAEAIFNKYAETEGLDHEAKSCGTSINEGDGISRGAYAVLLRSGINLGAHQAKACSEELLDWADTVLTMTELERTGLRVQYPEYEDKIETFAEEDIMDPFGGSLQDYRETEREIVKAVMDWFKAQEEA